MISSLAIVHWAEPADLRPEHLRSRQKNMCDTEQAALESQRIGLGRSRGSLLHRI
jgi:hypothetical protein